MRSPFLLASLALACGAASLVWACNNSNDNPQVVIGTDASTDVADTGSDSLLSDVIGPLPDSTNDTCTLADHKTDPVAICIQEQVLQFELQYAYTKGKGVAPTWSSAAPYGAGTGHRWQDDLGLAGALGAYYCSSEVYGNNNSTAAFGQVLVDLGPVLSAELKASPPAGYDGETYFRLRWAQAAYNYANDPQTAGILQSMADAYGMALAAQAYAVAPSAAVGDAGGGGGDAGGGDAGAGNPGNPGGVVIGTKNGDGSVAYAPVQTIMAAAALLDMAHLFAPDPDAGAKAHGWATTADQVVTYVLARGKDPKTGLFYQSLVTSGDPGHDALGPGQPTSDTFLVDDQAWIALALARAQDLRNSLPVVDAGDAATTPVPLYDTAGADLAAALTGANLFDGTTQPSSPAKPGAFLEGLGPAGILTNKTTTGNAILLGGLHRVATGAGTAQAYTLGQVRAALTQALPANSSLFSVVTDSNGNPVQQAYLRAGSKSFGYAASYAPDGGAAGQEQGATDYRTDALIAFVEGITQLWHGEANNPVCAP